MRAREQQAAKCRMKPKFSSFSSYLVFVSFIWTQHVNKIKNLSNLLFINRLRLVVLTFLHLSTINYREWIYDLINFTFMGGGWWGGEHFFDVNLNFFH